MNDNTKINEYRFPLLYKRNNTGNILSWTIIVQDNFYYTIYGCIDGVLIKTPPTFCVGKNIGKKMKLHLNNKHI